MPIYEYFCVKCEEISEKLVSLTKQAENEFNCNKCGKLLVKQISYSNFILKGPGFYKSTEE